MKKAVLIFLLLFTSFLAAESEGNLQNALEYLERGNFFSAMQELELAVQAEPENKDALIYLAYVYHIRGDIQKADALCRKILESDENSLVAILILADISYKQNDLSTALDLYRKAVVIQQNIKIAYIRLYELLKFEAKEEANSYYLRSFELEKTDLKDYLPMSDRMNRAGGYRTQDQLDLPREAQLPSQVPEGSDNELSFFLAPSSTEDEANLGSETNVILQTKVRSPLAWGTGIFRKFDGGFLFAKIIETLLVLLIAFLWGMTRSARKKRQHDIVFSSYRKK